MKQEKKSQSKKWIVIGCSLIILVLLASYTFIKINTYGASQEAQAVHQKAQEKQHYTLYESGDSDALGLIFYPGGLVEPNSYSIWANQLAQAGYDVYVVDFPLNLAVLAPNRAEAIQESYPQQKFVLAGHSLGGVMASRYVAEHSDSIVGMVFLASYPDEKGALNHLSMPVLSLTGTKDGVLNQVAYEDAKKYLPLQTDYESIEGGNHAGFGSYSPQKGDNLATISNEEQQLVISQRLIDWLKDIQ